MEWRERERVREWRGGGHLFHGKARPEHVFGLVQVAVLHVVDARAVVAAPLLHGAVAHRGIATVAAGKAARGDPLEHRPAARRTRKQATASHPVAAQATHGWRHSRCPQDRAGSTAHTGKKGHRADHTDAVQSVSSDGLLGRDLAAAQSVAQISRTRRLTRLTHHSVIKIMSAKNCKLN